MVYPTRHGYLTILGDSFETQEEWQTGFHLTSATAPSEAVLDALMVAIVDFLDTPALRFPSFCRFVGVKWAALEPDGTYPVGASSIEQFRAVPFVGTDTSGGYPQIALVTSLRTARPRGLGSNGRNYWPSAASINFGTGAIGATEATAIATAATVLVDAINDQGIGVVCVASAVGNGLLQPVTGVRVGRVMDTQRRRRNQLPELYGEVVPVPQ